MNNVTPFLYGQAVSEKEHIASLSDFFNNPASETTRPLYELRNAPFFMARVARRDQTEVSQNQQETNAQVVEAVSSYLSRWVLTAIPAAVDIRIFGAAARTNSDAAEAFVSFFTAVLNPPREFNQVLETIPGRDDRDGWWYRSLFEEIGELSTHRVFQASGVLPSKAFAEMRAVTLSASNYVVDQSFGINYFGVPAVETSLNLVRTEPDEFLTEFFRRADQSGYKVKEVRREHSARWKHSLEQYRFTALGNEWLDIDVFIDLLALKRFSMVSWAYQELRKNPAVIF